LGKALQRQVEKGKPVAAICAAPMVLGKLGIMNGKKATCYHGFEGFLTGAEYTGASVQRDGLIITGKGPGVSLDFALAVVDMLFGADKVAELKAAMMVPA
jgi:4-methyl-5(b-hydroxyethyl)-thiazole monophosphate biosynthesis